MEIVHRSYDDIFGLKASFSVKLHFIKTLNTLNKLKKNS